MTEVLVLTHPDDVHADAVVTHLHDAGVAVRRIDTAGLGGELELRAQLGGDQVIAGSFGGCDLSRVRCVWHRRPSEPAATDDISAAELRAALGGILAGLPHLNRPADMAAAALKPYQLLAAARAGLRVPPTVVATSAVAAQQLAQRHAGRVVVKPLARGAGRFVTADDRAGWSRPVHLTQQRIEKTHDVRLTVVDGEPFAVRIDSPLLDWRADLQQCGYRVVAVPAQVAAAVRELLTSLRLRYGALDFAVDGAGEWWFLEINPNGQWLWLEQATGLPISRAVAAALAHPASSTR